MLFLWTTIDPFVNRQPLSLGAAQNTHLLQPLHSSNRLPSSPPPPLSFSACTTKSTEAMSYLDQTTSAIKRLDARSDQSSFLQTTYAAPKPSERLPPPSGSRKASEKIVQFQNGTDSRKSQAHKRMRSASNRAGASSPQSVVSPSPTAPLSAPLPLAVGVTSLASPTTHDVPADNEVEEDEELVTA